MQVKTYWGGGRGWGERLKFRRYVFDFCMALKNLAHFLWPNPCFLMVHCSGKLYGRAFTNS
jgi:hypothetical protein